MLTVGTSRPATISTKRFICQFTEKVYKHSIEGDTFRKRNISDIGKMKVVSGDDHLLISAWVREGREEAVMMDLMREKALQILTKKEELTGSMKLNLSKVTVKLYDKVRAQ